MKALLDDAAIARIKAGYRFGIPAPILSKYFGVSVSNIYNWATDMSRAYVATDEKLLARLEALLLRGE